MMAGSGASTNIPESPVTSGKAPTRVTTGTHPASIASAVEFVLEGLHLNRKINKDKLDRKARYRK